MRIAKMLLSVTLVLATTNQPLFAAGKLTAAAAKLTGAHKKRIYWDGTAAEHRAMKEARKKYPNSPTLFARSEDQLLKKYQKAVWSPAGITERDFFWIMEEGVEKNWPSPPTPSQ